MKWSSSIGLFLFEVQMWYEAELSSKIFMYAWTLHWTLMVPEVYVFPFLTQINIHIFYLLSVFQSHWAPIGCLLISYFLIGWHLCHCCEKCCHSDCVMDCGICQVIGERTEIFGMLWNSLGYVFEMKLIDFLGLITPSFYRSFLCSFLVLLLISN